MGHHISVSSEPKPGGLLDTGGGGFLSLISELLGKRGDGGTIMAALLEHTEWERAPGINKKISLYNEDCPNIEFRFQTIIYFLQVFSFLIFENNQIFIFEINDSMTAELHLFACHNMCI